MLLEKYASFLAVIEQNRSSFCSTRNMTNFVNSDTGNSLLYGNSTYLNTCLRELQTLSSSASPDLVFAITES